MKTLAFLALLLAASCFQLAANSPQQCVEQHCGNDLSRCQRDYYCMAALQDCEKQCGNKTACYTTCISKWGSPNATSLWKCITENNCTNAISTALAKVAVIQSCISFKCAVKWINCRNDHTCVPALEECDARCGKKSDCWTVCLSDQGSPSARDAAICAERSGCVSSIGDTLAMASATLRQ